MLRGGACSEEGRGGAWSRGPEVTAGGIRGGMRSGPGCPGVGRLGLGWLVGAVGGLQACCACGQGAMGPAGPRAWEGSGEGVRGARAAGSHVEGMAMGLCAPKLLPEAAMEASGGGVGGGEAVGWLRPPSSPPACRAGP